MGKARVPVTFLMMGSPDFWLYVGRQGSHTVPWGMAVFSITFDCRDDDREVASTGKRYSPVRDASWLSSF